MMDCVIYMVVFFFIGFFFGFIFFKVTRGCNHEYDIVNKEKVTFGEGNYVAFQYYKVWLRCKKCGKLTSKRM